MKNQRGPLAARRQPRRGGVKRREDPPKRLEVFPVEQVEAPARAAETGAWGAPGTDQVAEEDHQLGDLLRIAACTGLRRGELIALRRRDWRNVVVGALRLGRREP